MLCIVLRPKKGRSLTLRSLWALASLGEPRDRLGTGGREEKMSHTEKMTLFAFETETDRDLSLCELSVSSDPEPVEGERA
jgi:hypothetical protein